MARHAALSIGFFRQEHWSRLPFPPQGIFLTQGWNLGHLHWQADKILYLLSHLGSPEYACTLSLKLPQFCYWGVTALGKIPGVLLTCCK